MPVFQYVREFLGDLASPNYNLDVTENKHYWVPKDDCEAVEDLTRAYLEGENHSFEFEPVIDSDDYQAVVDEVENMVITQLRQIGEISNIDGYGLWK